MEQNKNNCNIPRSSWGFQAIEDALQSHIKFSAVFCANDLVAYGAMNALSKHNLKIPNDISIIGFDDLDILSENVNLTTVRQAKFNMGKDAAEMLIHLIDGVEVKDIIATPELIIRSSVGRYSD